jgi:hypothetical protein
MSLVRGNVSADNNCLFTALCRLCEGVTSELQLKTAARRLRSVCADVVLADPDPVTRALMLGHDSVEAYSEWIRNEHHWGGESEVVMLASHFAVQVVVVSCEALHVLRYRPDVEKLGGTAYLLYTGQHYDPLLGPDGTLLFEGEGVDADREAAALIIAREHNEAAAKRALERRVKRLKCGGCGAIVEDAAAFQAHCGEVEHDEDFTYECEQVEIVIGADEALPDGSVDLNSPDVHSFYNASSPEALSLSMRCARAPAWLHARVRTAARFHCMARSSCPGTHSVLLPPTGAAAPFELDGTSYVSLEVLWRSTEEMEMAARRERLHEAVRAQ